MEVYVTADELKKSKNKVIQKMVELYGDKLEKVFSFEDNIIVYIEKEADVKLFIRNIDDLLSFSEDAAYIVVDNKKYYSLFLAVNNEILIEAILNDELSKKYEQEILKRFNPQNYEEIIKGYDEEKNYSF